MSELRWAWVVKIDTNVQKGHVYAIRPFARVGQETPGIDPWVSQSTSMEPAEPILYFHDSADALDFYVHPEQWPSLAEVLGVPKNLFD